MRWVAVGLLRASKTSGLFLNLRCLGVRSFAGRHSDLAKSDTARLLGSLVPRMAATERWLSAERPKTSHLLSTPLSRCARRVAQSDPAVLSSQLMFSLLAADRVQVSGTQTGKVGWLQ